MSTLSLRLPESLHRRLADLAEREGVSINQLISSAVAEKLAALMTEEYIAKRAGRANRSRFEAALSRVPDVPAAPEDALPRPIQKTRRRPPKARPRSKKAG